mmetsp:Transcript_44277/g.113949  ORF Transcript_44277/g.113949 Transcript_44277/m.113949 type:complete len:430 (-) Transcript_44277:63-1352(-)
MLNVAMKWGGELTKPGEQAAEALGARVRDEICGDIDVGSLQHDTKVYSSSEPRCQQTAAAFCRGLLRLAMPALPPIIAALVRKDGWGTLEAGGGGKNYVGGGSASEGGVESLDSPWAEIEATVAAPAARRAFAAAWASEALRGFAAPGPALLKLRSNVEHMLEAFSGLQPLGPLYNGETMGLLIDRYKDTMKDLSDGPRSWLKLEKLLDHLEFDLLHNRSAMPDSARELFDAAGPLCAALCDAQNALEVARLGGLEGEERDFKGLQFLYKLRWDLRVASGADLGEEKTHKRKHEHLYGEAGNKPCVRTRMYFSHNSHLQGLLIALARRPREGSHASLNGGPKRPPADACPDAAVVERLGFLAHFVIQLFRTRATREHRVVCHFRRSGDAPKVPLFDLSLQEADAWFGELLEGVEDPSSRTANVDTCDDE